MDDFTLMKLSGEAVGNMVQVNKAYETFVTNKKRQTSIIFTAKKALYRCVKSALLWYELFSGTLQDLGFDLNPYDGCVANKSIEGTQCTIVWYNDDHKIPHVNQAVVTHIIEKSEERFGKMTVTRGNDHTLLGMSFSFNTNQTFL
jgi:hypothetical protein